MKVSSDMVHRLKYNDRTDLGPWMARWMLRAGSELPHDCDILVPVPLHGRRFWLQRFNQSAELARYLARLSGKTFNPDALKRVKQTKQKVGFGANERTLNVRGAFKVPDTQEIKVRGRNVLLIDDVYTTGATVKAASRLAEGRRVKRLCSHVWPGSGARIVRLRPISRKGRAFSAEVLMPI